MNKRILGRTNLHVSEIAFGGVEIGMPYGIGVKGPQDMLTESDAIKLLHAAIDSGINFFDTARMYGNSEVIMGKAFADRRDKVVIATKCRHFRDKNGNLPPDRELKAFIERSLKESLQALQTGYVDLFMLHQADTEILENEVIAKVFSGLRKSGVVRAVGASTYQVHETEKVIKSGVWDVVQLPFNLMDQRQQSLFSLARQSGVGIVVRSVLLKGLLSDRAEGLHPALEKVTAHIRKYDAMVGKEAHDLAALAVKFALSFEEVSTVLIGIDKMEYLKRSLQVANGSYLQSDTVKKLSGMSYPDPSFLNLPHWEKMGWLT